MITPSSASAAIVSFVFNGSAQLKPKMTRFPSTIPAHNSPKTADCPTRSKISPPTFANTSMMATPIRTAGSKPCDSVPVAPSPAAITGRLAKIKNSPTMRAVKNAKATRFIRFFGNFGSIMAYLEKSRAPFVQPLRVAPGEWGIYNAPHLRGANPAGGAIQAKKYGDSHQMDPA